MKILHLTLLKKWFDAIACGEKVEEYRDIKPHWIPKLENRAYDEIHFTNGYGSYRPFMRVEFLGCSRGLFEGREVFIIKLGKILERRNFA